MTKEIVPASKELQDADAALRRAAISARKQAEQQGTPYVICEVTNDSVTTTSNAQPRK